jgi:hypothetical protein
MKTVLLAKSSSGEPYNVEFVADETSVRVFCHCQAGVLQRMCKHKLAFLKGDTKMLFDPKQATLLLGILSWPQFTSLKVRLDEYEKKLRQVEIAKEDLTKEEAEIKAEFARGLTFGFK